MLAEYAALPRLKHTPGQPIAHGAPVAVDLPHSLAEALAEDELTAHGRGYWVKSNYQRHDDTTWWKRGWISDWRRASYAIGDLAQQWPYRTMIEVVGEVPIEAGAKLEEFGLSGQSLQGGYCSITREQFEEALDGFSNVLRPPAER